MKKFNILILSLLFSLVSCNSDNTTTLNTTTQNETTTSSETTSAKKEEVDLMTAISNTKNNYSISMSNDYTTYLFSIYSSDFYYYAPSYGGYCLIDSDINYLHSYALNMVEDENNNYTYELVMYGKYINKSYANDVFTYDFMDILEEYCDDFYQIEYNTWACSVSDLGRELRDYFQQRSFSYCNYFEIIIENGLIKTLIPYEKSTDESYALVNLDFNPFSKNTYQPYINWVNNGSKINLRIFDIKLSSYEKYYYKVNYRNEVVTFEGYVASFNYSKDSIIVTTLNDTTGNVGILVKLNEDTSNLNLQLGDYIKVTGTVLQESLTAYISNDASIEVLSSNDSYPYFEEESIVDLYGGGYYSYNIFSKTPAYSGSIYSTYAYVYKLPELINDNEDTIIDMICPTFQSGDTYYQMQVILPSSMSKETKTQYVELLESYGLYDSDNKKEVYLEKFILKFNSSYEYYVQLEFGSESLFSTHLTPQEKVEKYIGISSFPTISTTTYSCFRFGGSSGMNLEEYYNKTGNTSGVYYYVPEATKDQLETEINGLISLGFTYSNEIKDAYSRVHVILTLNNTIIDIYSYSSGYSDEYVLNMWIYNGDLIYYKNIKDYIKENINYFDEEDFCMLDSYDADFTYYQLENYAGNKFSSGNYLNCITMDLDTSSLSSLRQAYLNKGYSSLRDENDNLVTYKTRGQTHYIMYKDIEGSNEKIYVDLAQYQNSDYTFSGYDLFSYRIEILIYKGTTILSPLLETNLDSFKDMIYENYNINISFNNVTDISVENYYPVSSTFITYGYCYNFDSFVYTSNVSTTLSQIQSSLLEAGYKLANTTSKGNYNYSNGNSYICVLPNTDYKYIRLINSVSGINF